MIADLLTHPEGEELYRIAVPANVVGLKVRDAMMVLKDGEDSLLVGVFENDRCTVNPPSEMLITAANELLVVRARPLDLR